MDPVLSDQIENAQRKWLALWKQGPRRTRWGAAPLQAGDPAPSVRLVDQRREPVELSELWRDRPALLIFWRHFGCGAGFERAKALGDAWGQLDEAGVRVTAIGQGEPERAAWYVERRGLPPALRFLCDPEGVAYAAFGLLEGLPHQVLYRLPEPIQRRDFDAGVAVARQRRDAGDPLVDSPWLMPGEFLVDTAGVVRMAHRYAHVFDIPETAMLLSAARAL